MEKSGISENRRILNRLSENYFSSENFNKPDSYPDKTWAGLLNINPKTFSTKLRTQEGFAMIFLERIAKTLRNSDKEKLKRLSEIANALHFKEYCEKQQLLADEIKQLVDKSIILSFLKNVSIANATDIENIEEVKTYNELLSNKKYFGLRETIHNSNPYSFPTTYQARFIQAIEHDLKNSSEFNNISSELWKVLQDEMIHYEEQSELKMPSAKEWGEVLDALMRKLEGVGTENLV